MDFQEEKRKITPWFVVGQVIKWTFIAAAVFMIAWLTYRGIVQRGTKKVKNIVFTDSVIRQYENDGTLDITEHGEYNRADTGKIFYISKVYSVKQSDGREQFQFLIRWNINAEFPAGLGKEQSDFAFLLADDCGNVYTEYDYVTDSKIMYRFIRLVFDGISTAEPTELKLYIYRSSEQPVDRFDYLDSCDVWFSDGYREEYALSSRDKKAIKNGCEFQHGTVSVAGKEETK